MPSDTPKIECRWCGSRLSKVTNTWQIETRWRGKIKTVIKRRRECLHCHLSFTTVETYEDENNQNQPEIDVNHPALIDLAKAALGDKKPLEKRVAASKERSAARYKNPPPKKKPPPKGRNPFRS